MRRLPYLQRNDSGSGIPASPVALLAPPPNQLSENSCLFARRSQAAGTPYIGVENKSGPASLPHCPGVNVPNQLAISRFSTGSVIGSNGSLTMLGGIRDVDVTFSSDDCDRSFGCPSFASSVVRLAKSLMISLRASQWQIGIAKSDAHRNLPAGRHRCSNVLKQSMQRWTSALWISSC